MMLLPHRSAPRASLRYSINKLGRRDEIVLKSTMRVLDHRFRHEWACVKTGAEVRVTTQAFGDIQRSDTVVYLACDVMVKHVALPLPLRAKDIEAAFNHVGDLLQHFREGGTADPVATFRDGDEFRLRRWPANALLDSRERLTLAAMFSARPSSVSSLQQSSNLPVDLCRRFVRDLMLAGLLTPSHVAQSSPPFPHRHITPPQRGLLARIRSRFGLLQNGWS